MSKESSVFVLGILVLLSSFIGFPREYKEWVLIGCGIFLMGIGYSLRRQAFFKSREHESGERKGDAFMESTIPADESDPPHKDNNTMV